MKGSQKEATVLKKRELKKLEKEEEKQQDEIHVQRESIQRAAKQSESGRRIKYISEDKIYKGKLEGVFDDDATESEDGDEDKDECFVEIVDPKKKEQMSSVDKIILKTLTDDFKKTYKLIQKDAEVVSGSLSKYPESLIKSVIRTERQKISRNEQPKVRRSKKKKDDLEEEKIPEGTVISVQEGEEEQQFIAASQTMAVDEYQASALLLVETYAEQSDETKAKIIDCVRTLLKSDEDIYFNTLKQQAKQEALLVESSFASRDYDAVLLRLSKLVPSAAVIVIFLLSSKFPTLKQESATLATIFLPLLRGVKSFSFITDVEQKQVAFQFCNTLLTYYKDTGNALDSGFIRFVFELDPSLVVQALKKEDQPALQKALQQSFTEKESKIIARFATKFLYKSVIDFLQKLKGEERTSYIEIMSKLIVPNNPIDYLTQLRDLFYTRALFQNTLKELETIDVPFKHLVQVLQNLRGLSTEAIVTCLLKPSQNWLEITEQLLSGVQQEDEEHLTQSSAFDVFKQKLDQEFDQKSVEVLGDVERFSLALEQRKMGYKHNYYQCVIAALLILRTETAYKFVEVPTGAGKTWIYALLSLYYIDKNRPVLIVEPNRLLKTQTAEFLFELSHDLSIVTIQEFYHNPPKNPQTVLIVDEYDTITDELPYYFFAKDDTKKEKDRVSGIWQLSSSITLFFSATSSMYHEKLVAQFCYPFIKLKFQSEFELVHKISPSSNGMIKPCADLDVKWKTFEEDLVTYFPTKPIVIFCEISDQEKVVNIIQERHLRPFLVGGTSNNLRTIRSWKTGILILEPQHGVGVNCKFQVDSVVLILNEMKSYHQYLQTMGRSSRSRGLCHSVYYPITAQDQFEVERSLKFQHHQNYEDQAEVLRFIHNRCESRDVVNMACYSQAENMIVREMAVLRKILNDKKGMRLKK